LSLLIGNQGNKADEFAKKTYGLPVDSADEMKLLRVGRANGDDHASTFAKLSGQGGRDTERGSRNEDSVERCTGRKPEGAIAGEDADIGIAERRESATGTLGEGCVTLDGEDLGGKFREQSGDVARARANFKNYVGRQQLKRFEHEGDDVGLRDRLPIANRTRMIFVGLGAASFRNEFVAGDLKHGVEDAWVGDPACPELGLDHMLTSGGRVGHERWSVVSDQWSVGTLGLPATDH
jgi:hypothetical protein